LGGKRSQKNMEQQANVQKNRDSKGGGRKKKKETKRNAPQKKRIACPERSQVSLK